MNEIIHIRDVKARLDPEYYIKTVLDTPEHQERRRARQIDERRRALEAERQMRTADLNILLLKVMMISGGVGALATLIGLS